MKFELDSLVNQNRIASSLPAQENISKKMASKFSW